MNTQNHAEDPALERIEQRSRELLVTSAAVLPGRIQSRLTAARAAAVEAHASRARGMFGFRPGFWVPVGSVAAAAVLAVAIWTSQPSRVTLQSPVAEATTAEDADMLASNDGPELVADDVDFYEWAGNAPAAGPG